MFWKDVALKIAGFDRDETMKHTERSAVLPVSLSSSSFSVIFSAVFFLNIVLASPGSCIIYKKKKEKKV